MSCGLLAETEGHAECKSESTLRSGTQVREAGADDQQEGKGWKEIYRIVRELNPPATDSQGSVRGLTKYVVMFDASPSVRRVACHQMRPMHRDCPSCWQQQSHRQWWI